MILYTTLLLYAGFIIGILGGIAGAVFSGVWLMYVMYGLIIYAISIVGITILWKTAPSRHYGLIRVNLATRTVDLFGHTHTINPHKSISCEDIEVNKKQFPWGTRHIIRCHTEYGTTRTFRGYYTLQTQFDHSG